MQKKQFRAVCTNCNYLGFWKNTEDEANEDALQHQDDNNHIVDIDFK